MKTTFICEGCEKKKDINELIRYYPPWHRENNWDYKVFCLMCAIVKRVEEKNVKN